MAAWNIYVLAKLLLQWMGYIRLDPVPELLAYALVFALSRRKEWTGLQRAAAAAGTAFLGAALLWHESFLPPPEEALRYLLDPALRPDKKYFMRFAKNLFKPWQLLAMGCAAAAAWRFRARKAPGLTPLVSGVLLAAIVLWPGPDRARLSAQAQEFFAAEASRVEALPPGEPDFDVLIIHVCSLSWSDLWRTGLQDHPFLSEFDVLFSSFNTVSSYSEQSTIRLLRAPCGQGRNDALYADAAPECYLLDGLRRSGYRAWSAMNHSGEYLEMAKKVQRWGRAEPLMDVSDLPAAKLNFNGTDIHDDYAVLERLWKARQASKAPRAALYYNTVSLHTGAYPVGERRGWELDPALRYGRSARELFDELDRFFDLLRASGRRVVVLFVPEHGAAIQGSQYLVPGMRDLPLPAITLAPVGIKLIGRGFARPGARRLVVGRPVSYLALAHALAGLLACPRTADRRAALERAAAGAPATRYLAENKRMVVLADGKDLYLRWMDKKWVKLPRKFHPDRVRTREEPADGRSAGGQTRAGM